MAYDGFYSNLSARASVNEIVNQALRIQAELTPVSIATEQARVDTLAATARVEASEARSKGYAETTQTESAAAQGSAVRAEEAAQKAESYTLQAVYSTGVVQGSSQVHVGVGTTTITHIMLSAGVTQIIANTAVHSPVSRQFTLILNQGQGARKVTWSPNIRWADGRVPVLSFEPGAEDIVTLLQVGTGTNYYGFFNGGSFA